MNTLTKSTMKGWAEDDLPREKFLKQGPDHLTDSELLAIVMASGSHRENVLDLSKRMLASVGNNLQKLSELSVNELCKQFHGVGKVKAITLKAALELGKRRMQCELPEKPRLDNGKAVYDQMKLHMAELKHEECWALYLNASNKLLGKKCISVGGINETTVDVRIVMKTAIDLLATSFILCHNHPSGNHQPSHADTLLTERVKSVSKVMGITMLDHVIVCERTYYSYAEQGKM